MTLTDAELDRLEAVGPKDGFATILWQDVHALIAEVRQCRAEGAWRPMDSAPLDGRVVEVCARYPDASAGFPQYAAFYDGHWWAPSRMQGQSLVCWAWRPRDDNWPSEPSPPRSEP